VYRIRSACSSRSRHPFSTLHPSWAATMSSESSPKSTSGVAMASPAKQNHGDNSSNNDNVSSLAHQRTWANGSYRYMNRTRRRFPIKLLILHPQLHLQLLQDQLLQTLHRCSENSLNLLPTSLVPSAWRGSLRRLEERCNRGESYGKAQWRHLLMGSF